MIRKTYVSEKQVMRGNPVNKNDEGLAHPEHDFVCSKMHGHSKRRNRQHDRRLLHPADAASTLALSPHTGGGVDIVTAANNLVGATSPAACHLMSGIASRSNGSVGFGIFGSVNLLGDLRSCVRAPSEHHQTGGAWP